MKIYFSSTDMLTLACSSRGLTVMTTQDMIVPQNAKIVHCSVNGPQIVMIQLTINSAHQTLQTRHAYACMQMHACMQGDMDMSRSSNFGSCICSSDSVPHSLSPFEWGPYHSIVLLSGYQILAVWTQFVSLAQSLPGEKTPKVEPKTPNPHGGMLNH